MPEVDTLEIDALRTGLEPQTCQAATPQGANTCPPWAGVLANFYRKRGLALPPMVRVEAPEIPPPYRRLLAHNADMTTTLEAFHGEALALRVCGREETNDAYCREVVLALQSSDRPVEYGAICIHLRRFPRRVQGMIRTEEHPFGRILQNESIAHLGWPQAFFVVGADLHMSELLGLDKPALLYGRRNVLLNHRRQLLAEVIEILPPAPILPHCGVTSS